jgi:molecular chaperone DnaK (HSP70)
MAKAVGIDLGTTHTVVAWADLAHAAAPAVFAIPQLVAPAEVLARPLFPSCLYAPVPGETVADPWGEAPWVSGELARRRGAEVPGRLVASSKSWLCHPRVDRAAPILPWGAPEEETDLPRISPIDAAAKTLAHVRRAWDEAFPDEPLAEQEVVLTVPASFDEVARELTLEAATRAGLAVRLLEEPQAAFYDFMARASQPRA